MKKHGRIILEQLPGDTVLVGYLAVLPCDKAARCVQALQRMEQADNYLPGADQVIGTSRSFGKLPPGAYPSWQSREWVGFTLWAIAVLALFVGALWRNFLFFF